MTILFVVCYIGTALLRYRTKIVGGEIGRDSSNAIDSFYDIESIKRYLIIFIIFVLINIWGILDYWIEKRKSTYNIYFICGASKLKLFCRQIIDFLVIVLLSLIYAQLFILMIKCTNIEFVKYINLLDLKALSFIILCCFIGILMCIIKHFIKRNKYWVLIRYILFAIQMIIAAYVIIRLVIILSNFIDFTNKINKLTNDFTNAYYAYQINPDEFADNSEKEFEVVNKKIYEITQGNCFSFGESSISFENIKNGKKHVEFSENETDYYNCIFVTDLFKDIYDWDFIEGGYWSENEFNDESSDNIPIILGYNYKDVYSVGELIDNKYVIVGFLNKKSFYLNPRWEGKVFYLDDSIIMPMVELLDKWGGAYINQLNILTQDKQIHEEIKELIEEANMPEIGFRSMKSQMEYIKDDVNANIKFYGTVAFLLIVISTISQVSMLLLLIEIESYKNAIKIMCGATKKDIIIRMMLPIYIIIFMAFGLNYFLFMEKTIVIKLILIAFVIATMVIIWPCYYLFKKPLINILHQMR